MGWEDNSSLSLQGGFLMQDFIQEVDVGQSWKPAVYAAAGTPEWISMKNHRYCTFVITLGSVTAGEEYKVQKAINKSGSSAADITHPFVGNIYYTNRSSTSNANIMTQTAAVSTGSIDTIDIANTDSSHTIMATVDAVTVTSAAKPYIALVATGSGASSMAMATTYFLHGSRYQNETAYTNAEA